MLNGAATYCFWQLSSDAHKNDGVLPKALVGNRTKIMCCNNDNNNNRLNCSLTKMGRGVVDVASC